MQHNLDVSVKKAPTDQLKNKPDEQELGFGRYFTDHMFLMQWNRQRGWHDAEISPFQDFRMSPAAMVLHYGQAIFEGMKAYRSNEGEILLFRPKDNFARLNRSADVYASHSGGEGAEKFEGPGLSGKRMGTCIAGGIPVHPADHDSHRVSAWRQAGRYLSLLYYNGAGGCLLSGRVRANQNLCL